MRILVFSDSHGNSKTLYDIIKAQREASYVIHLGDGFFDLDEIKGEFPEKQFYAVRGNCDFFCEAPTEMEFTIEDKRFFITHGHLYNVKSTDSLLLANAENFDFVLYGHTHLAYNRYENGTYVLNPGTTKGYNASYGVIDITENGVFTNIIKL